MMIVDLAVYTVCSIWFTLGHSGIQHLKHTSGYSTNG